jgi:hypothetical protein
MVGTSTARASLANSTESAVCSRSTAECHCGIHWAGLRSDTSCGGRSGIRTLESLSTLPVFLTSIAFATGSRPFEVWTLPSPWHVMP